MITTNAILKKKNRPIFAAIFAFTAFSGCEIFEKEEKLVSEHKQANGTVVKVYYVTTGATTNEVMQVRKMGRNEIETVIASYEKYIFLEKSALMNDTTLVMILKDTLSFDSMPDTIKVNVR